MILIDTHIWYWWVTQSPRLLRRHSELIRQHQSAGIGLSIISWWEVAKKNQLGKLELDRPIEDWLNLAIRSPGVRLLPLTPEIVLDSTSLPDGFRSDPADELILATARVHQAPLLTADGKLLACPHVPLL